jgi:UDP-glucose 4-epimerase
MQNILFLGGSGFLGKNIISSLLSQDDIRIVVFDRINNFLNCNEKVAFYEGNLDTHLIEILEKEHISTVVHCISLLVPASDYIQYIADIEDVAVHTIKIIDYCAKNNVRFVYLSSGGTVYGDSDEMLREEEQLRPISFYGLSKLQMEEAILFYNRRYAMEYLIIRPSNPFGPGQNLYGKQGLIAVLLGKIINNEVAEVFGDGSILRDYIYIDDFVYYIRELLIRKVKNLTINIGSGSGYSINQIISFIETISNKTMKVRYLETRKNDLFKVVLDVSRLNSLLPYKQKSLKEGIVAFYHSILS